MELTARTHSSFKVDKRLDCELSSVRTTHEGIRMTQPAWPSSLEPAANPFAAPVPSGVPATTPVLRLDKLAHEVAVSGRDVGLTAKEFALLVYFVDHRGEALSRQRLIEDVWGPEYAGSSRTVDIHVRRLRIKLGAAFDLVTLRGVGYRLGSALSQRPRSLADVNAERVADHAALVADVDEEQLLVGEVGVRGDAHADAGACVYG